MNDRQYVMQPKPKAAVISKARGGIMILEVAMLNVKPGQGHEFETAFSRAQVIITNAEGYISHQLQRCIENNRRYLLLVIWQNLQSHTVGFRESDEYQEWSRLLHHFYDPFPTVEHYVHVMGNIYDTTLKEHA